MSSFEQQQDSSHRNPLNIMTLGDPMSKALGFLSQKDLWTLEFTCTHFRRLCQAEWQRREAQIAEWNRCKMGTTNLFAGRSMPNSDMAAPISIPKVRVNKFARLSKFAEKVEKDNRNSSANDMNADTDAEVFGVENDMDVFYRLSKSVEGMDDSKLIWQGFLKMRLNKGYPGMKEYANCLLPEMHAEILSNWPEIRAYFDCKTDDKEQLKGLAETAFEGVAMTIVAMNRYFPKGKPVAVTSTRELTSNAYLGQGCIGASFTTRKVDYPGFDDDDSEDGGSTSGADIQVQLKIVADSRPTWSCANAIYLTYSYPENEMWDY